MAETTILLLNSLPMPTSLFLQRNVKWTSGFVEVLRQQPSAHLRVQAAALILNYCHQQKSTEADMRSRLSQVYGAPPPSPFDTHFDWLPVDNAKEGTELLREIYQLLQSTLQVPHLGREIVLRLLNGDICTQSHCLACSSCCSSALLVDQTAQVSLATVALPLCMCSLASPYTIRVRSLLIIVITYCCFHSLLLARALQALL